MQSAKSKAGLSETPPNNKTRPATPKGSQLPRARSTKSDSNSPSTLQKSKALIERSPKSVNSKSVNGHLVSKTSNPNKQERRTKVSLELQSQLDSVQEELKKTNERLASVENEKAQALEELKNVDEKLEEAQKMKEELRKRLASMQTSDAKALASAKEEIESLKSELTMAVDAKNVAMDHANNAKKTAEANAAKAERVSAEVSRLRNLLNSRKETMDNDCSAELVRTLKAEVELLKHELTKVAEMEEMIEDLKIEISDAKRAESEACANFDELKKKAEFLEIQVDEANRAHRSSSETLASAMKEMEESNARLLQSQAEVDVLKEKLESLRVELARKSSDMEESDRQLEISKSEIDEIKTHVLLLKAEVARKDSDLEESHQRLEMAKREAMEMVREIEILKSELKSLEEKDGLVLEFETANAEREKLKKAMDDISSAMREVPRDARHTQEMLGMKQAECKEARAEIEELKLALHNTKENYNVMLDEAKYEIVCLKKAAERMEDAKDRNFVEVVKRTEEEIAYLEGSNEGLKSRERWLEKENELQRMVQENNDLRTRVEELTSLLEEVKSKDVKENGNGIILGVSTDESEHHRSNLSIAKGSDSIITEEPVEVDAKDFISETEAEAGSVDEELDPKTDSGSFEKINELPSESMENGQKKKRNLFKFGGLLTKKSYR